MEPNVWKKKRNRTIKAYLFFKTCVAIETTLIVVTIIPYLKERVSEKDADFFYSLESTADYVVSTIAAIVIGRIVDRTRCVKYSILFALTCGTIGELLYTFRFSPYLVVAARALCGTLPAQDYILRGEIVRIFDQKEASKVLWWYTTAATFGYIIGSGVNLLFNGIHFHVGIWRINSNNFAGVLLSGLYIINIVIVHFFVHDCSKEYDLKSYIDSEKMNAQNIREKNSNSNKANIAKTASSEVEDHIEIVSDHDSRCSKRKDGVESSNSDATSVRTGKTKTVFDSAIDVRSGEENRKSKTWSNSNGSTLTNEEGVKSVFQVLRIFIFSPDILFIMTSTFLYAGVAFVGDLMSPIIILDTLNWEPKYLSIQQIIYSTIMLVASLLLSKYGVSNKGVYITSLMTIASSCVSVIILIVLTLTTTALNVQIVLVVLYSASIIPLWYLDLSLLPNMLGRMVGTDVQSFAESCRSVFSLSSVIIVGTFIAADGYAKYLFFGLIGLIATSILIFVYARKRFINIELVKM